MGDRNNPIKFGPEWLRNSSRERNPASTNINSQSTSLGSNNATGAAGSAGTGGPRNNPAPGPSRENQSTSQNSTKIQLADLRYGREEMLALIDKSIEPPSELKNIDILYQARGYQPAALDVTFEERENTRNVQPPGNVSLGERYGMGRGFPGRGFLGRGSGQLEGRGRSRRSYIRQPPAVRSSWHTGPARVPLYNANTDEETSVPRPWNSSNNNNPNPSGTRNNSEQTEWQTKTYRSRRPGSSANWRQMSRDDGEEWRSDAGRSRPQDKWDRDWGNRTSADKSQPWNPNRRTWGGPGEAAANTEDNLPEWAVENAGACGGTFDSSGAFHGYSNDDSNLPKSQENAYSLTRSHTQGSFVRQKTVDEGSEEWWTSDKAKKLSPKRFNAGDIKFKKPPAVGTSGAGTSTVIKPTEHKDDDTLVASSVSKNDSVFSYEESSQATSGGTDKNKNTAKSKFVESKTFDSLMMSDINIEESYDEGGNFQSVMITSNNMLRQKHQNIVLPINEDANNLNRKPGVLHLPRVSNNPPSESSLEKSNMLTEDKILDNMFKLAIDKKVQTSNVSPLLNVKVPPPMSACITSITQPRQQFSNPMQVGLQNQSLGLPINQNNNPNVLTPVMQHTGAQSSMIQQVGITSPALNASLGLPLGGSNLGIPFPGVPPPVLPNPAMVNPGMVNVNIGANSLQVTVEAGMNIQSGTSGLPGFHSSLSRMSAPDFGNNSLFMGQTSNNSGEMQVSNGFQLPNNARQDMFSVHGLQHSTSQTNFANSIYSNILPQNPPQPPAGAHGLTELWYYEDPKQIIQGPFTSQEMLNWYRAGFFDSSLMVRRACESVMRPLGSYGPIVPFAQMEMRPYQLPADNMLNNQQSGLGLGVINISNMNMSNNNPVDTIHRGSFGFVRNPPYGQNPMVESLWGQSTASTDLMWMQHDINSRNENRVNNLHMFFWDQQPSAIASNSTLPEGIHKEMKTEDQILAQLRASQDISTTQTKSFIGDQPSVETPVANKSNDSFNTSTNVTPNLEELQKLIQKEAIVTTPPLPSEPVESSQQPINTTVKPEVTISEPIVAKPATIPKPVENKTTKQLKNEGEKVTKKSEKNKNEKIKKVKEEKKEELTEAKVKDKEVTDLGKRSAETSPSKSKKEEKVMKKDLEKEKKEWIKDGFTIVKGSEKNVNKDNKKKAEDLKVAEELERKKKEDDKLAALEEKKKKQLEALKKQQDQPQQQQQQKQISELVLKKAPWSVTSNQITLATNKDGLTLTEIQRLEREKKLEQIKEQQHMMQIIAQQQAAALARDQEMQAGLNWAKKKPSTNLGSQTLAVIQAETRKQAVPSGAASMTSVLVVDEPPPITASSSSNNHIPWGNTHNGVIDSVDSPGGFWDTQPIQNSTSEKAIESSKTLDASKTKKKPTVITTMKKEASPAAEFENWCSVELASWSSKIDVPTFVGFLKDIESPYEVKDYVKCYLGESKDSSDFARQFLERRSKLLRVGMVTPSDDLCSPAIAVNPRTVSGSDYQEVKGKGKKIKKNKMQKIDARILGFSVTAAEDRINVGDIDTA